ncbi:hypothetical protein [Priestia megaterium]|nr:hypothetical protein [Priestia megaterium]
MMNLTLHERSEKLLKQRIKQLNPIHLTLFLWATAEVTDQTRIVSR